MHRFIALGLMALLAGCGSPSVDGTRPLSRQILDQSLALLKPKAAQAAPEPEVLTRASVTKDTTGPVILVSAPKLRAKASLNMIQENGPTRTYVSEHSAAHRAILKGSRRYERVLRHINSQNYLEAQALSCSLTDHGAETVTILGHKHGVLRRVETCDLAGRQIENIFWVAEETIWKSQQWVNDQIGSLTIAHVQ